MVTKAQLQEELAGAMRAGDSERRDLLRLLLAAVKQEEVDSGEVLDRDALQTVFIKQAKQRQETIADAKKAGRDDLIAEARAELAIIESYLPEQVSEEEIERLAAQLIEELDVRDVKSMGQVMGRLMPQLKGRADGRIVSQTVRRLLTER